MQGCGQTTSANGHIICTEEEQESKASYSKATESQITIRDKKIILKYASELYGCLLGADG